MNPISFFTRTRRAGRIDITDILSWVWLIGGTFAVLVPVLWAGLSSLKPAAEITRFPPTLLPRAAVEQTVPGFGKRKSAACSTHRPARHQVCRTTRGTDATRMNGPVDSCKRR